MSFKARMPGQTQPDLARWLAIAETAMGKLSSTALHLPPSAARPMDLSTECPHQTTLKPTSLNNLPSPFPCRAECGPLSWVRTSVPGELSHLIVVGVLCAARDTGPFVWELCGDAGRHAVSNISHVKFPWSLRSPSGSDVHLGLNSYACHGA